MTATAIAVNIPGRFRSSPILDYTAASPDGGLFSEALEDWRFRGSTASLTGAVNAQVATAADGANPPTWSAEFVTTIAGVGRGIILPFEDRQEFTELSLVKRSTTQAIITGTITTTAGEGGTGLGWLSTTLAINSGGVTQGTIGATGVTNGDWCVVGLCHAPKVRFGALIKKDGTLLGTTARATAWTPSTIGNNRCIGNVYYNSAGVSGAVNCARHVFWPRPLTQDEMMLAARRILQDATSRGLI